MKKNNQSESIAVHTYRVASRRIPKAYDGLRIAALADLHGRRFGEGQRALLERVSAQNPDYIFFAGDFLVDRFEDDHKAAICELFEGLVKIAPVYAIFGNHETLGQDRGPLYTALVKIGVKVLLDQTVALAPKGARQSGEGGEMGVFLTGFYTAYEHEKRDHAGLKYRNRQVGPKLRAEYSAAARIKGKEGAGAEERPYQIALGHRPELFPLYCELGLDLVISGHVHGGVFRFPSGRRLVAPDQGFFPEYAFGPYRKGSTLMLVSEGLGGPRINVGQGFMVIELHAKVDK